MPNLAGFDLIIEVALNAIERELLNTPIATGPSGPPNDTLVPPFWFIRNIPLTGYTGILSLKVTKLNLQSHPRSSIFTLNLSFEEASLEAPGISISMLAGHGYVTAPLYFTKPTSKNGLTLPISNLVMDFTHANSTLRLNQESSDRLNNEVGLDLAEDILNALSTALTGLFKLQGMVDLNFSFSVDTSQNSTDMMILTAAPQVRWIDKETLAIFGYHRQGANTGNASWKNDSDLQPAPYPSFPWYPIAVLVSTSSFQLLVACPAIRGAARDHVSGRYRNAWIDEERALNNNQGDATDAEIASADSRLTQYLNSPLGQVEINGAVPGPCGYGQIDQRIKLPNPFPDTTGFIHWLSMELDNGKVIVNAKAHAQVFCGSVSVEVPMSFKPFIGHNNTIQPGPITKGKPNSNVQTDVICKVAIATLSTFLVGPFIGSIFTILAVAVAERLAEGLVNSKILKQNLPSPGSESDMPALPTAIRLREINIGTSGLTILGVWEGMVIDPHKFNPSVRLYWKSSHTRSSSVLTIPGSFEANCGGEPSTFRFTSFAWDTTIVYNIEAIDVPHPIHYEGWWLWHDGIVHRLVSGTLKFPGRVIIPKPPNKETIQSRDEIVVRVVGSDDQGFSLIFRAEDVNVPFQVTARVVDGSGRLWLLGTNQQKTQGLTFKIDKEYSKFAEDCARNLIGVGDRFELVQDVPVWDQVTSVEQVIQDRMRRAVHNQLLGGASVVRQLMVENPQISQQLFRME